MSAKDKTANRAAAETVNNLTDELRARVPEWMKAGVASIANERVLDDADILREAVSEYLDRRKPKDPNQLDLAIKEKAA